MILGRQDECELVSLLSPIRKKETTDNAATLEINKYFYLIHLILCSYGNMLQILVGETYLRNVLWWFWWKDFKVDFSVRKRSRWTYPTSNRIREIIHSTYWYFLCLVTEVALWPEEAYFWLIHMNCGRIKNTNPRRKPETNPPIWAKLSTCGRTPTAKFITIMTMRVSNAANCK